MRFPRVLAALLTTVVFFVPARYAAAQYTPAELCFYFNVCDFTPPSSPDATDDAPDVVQNTYYLRGGDLNGDGKGDFLVTGASILRRVQDFILLSNNTGYQTILYANLTATQQQTVRNWPVRSEPVGRVDIDMDGYFDLVLDEINNGNDVVVLTTNSGTMPRGAVVVNDDVRHAAQEIASAVLNPQATVAFYDSSYTYYITYQYYIACSDIPTSGCGYWIDITIPQSIPGAAFFSQTAQRFISGNRAALQSGALKNTFMAAATLPGERVVLGAAAAAVAARIGIFALRIAIASVLVVDAPVIITGALVAITAYGVYQAVSGALTDSPPSDRGPVPTTPILTPDPFDPCQRHSGPEILRSGISDDSARYDLKKNLESRGCSKPHPDAQAHHIVPLRSNPGGSVGNGLRTLLQRNGININESSNGVWLPKNANIGTRAMSHSVAHSEEVLSEINRRLIAAEARGGASAIRQELTQIGEQMARSEFTW